MEYSSSCDLCTSQGGYYCEVSDPLGGLIQVCSSPDIAAQVGEICFQAGGTAYVSDPGDCAPPGQCNVLADECIYAFDLICDDPTGLGFCNPGTDW